MNAMPNPNPDSLDRLLSSYFKAQMKRPWPAAPLPTWTEPSELVAVQNKTTPVHAEVPIADTGLRARITLAVSAGLLLGGCWYLSSGWQPAARPVAAKPGPVGGPNVLPEATAENPAALEQLKKDKVTRPDITQMPMGPITDPFGKQP